VEAARMLVYRAAWLKDQGHKVTRETSIAKLFAVEAAVRNTGYQVLRLRIATKGLQVRAVL